MEDDNDSKFSPEARERNAVAQRNITAAMNRRRRRVGGQVNQVQDAADNPPRVFTDADVENNVGRGRLSVSGPSSEQSYEPPRPSDTSRLRRPGGRERPVRPVVGSGQLEEMRRRASIDARSSMTNPAADIGPRLGRGLTRAQRGQLTSAPTANDFLANRLQSRLTAAQENPAEAAARERQQERLESDRNFNLGERGIDAQNNRTEVQERLGLRRLDQDAVRSGQDFAIRSRQAKIGEDRNDIARTEFETDRLRRAEDARQNTRQLFNINDDGTIDFESYRNMGVGQQREFADAFGATIGPQLRASGVALGEEGRELSDSDIGQLAATFMSNTGSELANMDPERAAQMRQTFGGGRDGVQRMIQAALTLRTLNPDVRQPTSLNEMNDALLDMAANEKNQFFGFGSQVTDVDGETVNINDASGFVRSNFNTLMTQAKTAAAQQIDSPKAQKALANIYERELEEVKASIIGGVRGGSAGELDTRRAVRRRAERDSPRVQELQSLVDSLRSGEASADVLGRLQEDILNGPADQPRSVQNQ